LPAEGRRDSVAGAAQALADAAQQKSPVLEFLRVTGSS
jgi:hypothetical protein